MAVSAPLEDNGVIYIFYGSVDVLIQQYAQRINAKQLKPVPEFHLHKFGPTVVGNIDFDHNGYPGILIIFSLTYLLIILFVVLVISIH